MDLCSKENHCEFCEKAFCCYACRFKHESSIHKKNQSNIDRKPSFRKTAFQKKNSLPKILESIEFNNNNQVSKDNRKKNSIFIYEDISHLEDTTKNLKDASTTTEGENIPIELLTDEKITRKKKKILRIISSEEPLHITVNGDDKLAHFLGFSQGRRKTISENAENIENIPPNKINDNKTSNTNAGNTPPRAISLILEKSLTMNSVDKADSENSSIYCACSENWNKSDNPKWVSASSEIYDSTANIVRENSENSSIYFACSERLSKELSTKKCSNRNEFFDEFEMFQKSSKLASTKLDISICSAQEALESEGDPKTEYVSSTSLDYLKINKDMNSKNGNVRTDNITANMSQNDLRNILQDCSPISIRTIDRSSDSRQEYLSDWARACATQTSIESRMNSLRDQSGSEDKDSSSEQVEVIDGKTVSVNEETKVLQKRDTTFWNSFSNSLQRAFNSTKEMCNSIGRRNKSKRDQHDIEGPEPKRQKLAILCRPPIRDNPRIIFRQDGDVRRPVIAYDRGTQTDDFLFEDEY
ncbi:dentin sialophosphoprotein-like [Harmonia axyridis]|uniref:dentin sialophosphoprotein-like n=1 Tax=Harmonia axyridis TaxID=115357 RepID=UPI001E278AE2|nr:dentin sialophosphoprotein-like [Harmonia axyridis]